MVFLILKFEYMMTKKNGTIVLKTISKNRKLLIKQIYCGILNFEYMMMKKREYFVETNK